VETRQQAQELISAGRVTVNGAPAFKAARQVSGAEAVLVSGPPPRFVSRAGHKLEAALDTFAVDPDGRVGLDIGSSTGGFTDCLLQEGAQRVVAIDVGTNQLHERLRSDDRVTSMENTHIRDVTMDTFAGDDAAPAAGFGIVVADLSFISTTGLLPHMAGFLAGDGDLLVLVKPQFEAGRAEVSKGRGIIRDAEIWKRVLHEFIDAAGPAGLEVEGLAISPVIGGKGNVEFLAHLRRAAILGDVTSSTVASADRPGR